MAKSCGATQPGADRFSYPFQIKSVMFGKDPRNTDHRRPSFQEAVMARKAEPGDCGASSEEHEARGASWRHHTR